MANKNYLAGAGFERRRIRDLLDKKIAIRGDRNYASRGICDLWYVDQKGIVHEEQLKYSRIKCPVISTDEFTKLIQYALDMEGKIKVSLVSKQSRKSIMVWHLN
jgi:hypothetical protein